MKKLRLVPSMYARANHLRNTQTFQERLLGKALFETFSPYRATIAPQEIIGQYIADFVIYPANVIVEVDGRHHRVNPEFVESDRRRDTFLQNRGFQVLRFSNEQVCRGARQIAEAVLKACFPLQLKSEPIQPTICPPRAARGSTGTWSAKRAKSHRIDVPDLTL